MLLPLLARRLLIVTGKGGVGKTTVAAAAALAAARAGRRVLVVEIGKGRLGPVLGLDGLGASPTPAGRRLLAASLDPEAALESFVRGLMPVPFLARRLLASTTFRIVTAAAPGLDDFVVLHRIHAWVQAGRRPEKHANDLVVVDAPASGHSLPLLSAPRILHSLARVGPGAESARRIEALLADPARTAIAVVSMPEEMAINETVELYRNLAGLGLPLLPPVVNAVPPPRFTAEDERALEAAGADGRHPFIAAARFQIDRQRQAEAHIARLACTLGTEPLRLPYLYREATGVRGLMPLVEAIGQQARDATGADPA